MKTLITLITFLALTQTVAASTNELTCNVIIFSTTAEDFFTTEPIGSFQKGGEFSESLELMGKTFTVGNRPQYDRMDLTIEDLNNGSKISVLAKSDYGKLSYSDGKYHYSMSCIDKK
jgi:hypothetical protein